MTSEALDGQLQSCYAARARPKCIRRGSWGGASIVKSVMVVACIRQSHLHYFTTLIYVTSHLVTRTSVLASFRHSSLVVIDRLAVCC